MVLDLLSAFRPDSSMLRSVGRIIEVIPHESTHASGRGVSYGTIRSSPAFNTDAGPCITKQKVHTDRDTQGHKAPRGAKVPEALDLLSDLPPCRFSPLPASPPPPLTPKREPQICIWHFGFMRGDGGGGAGVFVLFPF